MSAAADPEAAWLVTGCSSGFGREIARVLAAQGRCLVATARDPDRLDFLAPAESTLTARLDVTEPDTIEAAVAAALDRFGRLDVVVNNAGIGVIGPVEDVSEADARLQIEVNLFGVLNVVRATAPVFRRQRRGLFVNTASMAGEVSIDSLGLYSASKFAVEGLSEALKSELRPYGVEVMIVEPGPFDTEWLGKNAIWAERDDERYPEVWNYVDMMRGVYADRAQVGDPARAAAAIVAAALESPPPDRLPLGAMSFDATHRKIDALKANLARVEPGAPDMRYHEETAP